MIESNKIIRPEQSHAFASAWLEHRLGSARLHSFILYPAIIELLDSVPGSVLADYGCGAGELTLEILKTLEPSKVIAIDVNQHLLESGHLASNDRIQIICQDVAEVSPIESASVNGLVCTNVVMHLTDCDCSRLFNEISRVLSPAGVAVVVFTHPLWAELQYNQEGSRGRAFDTTRNWNGCEFVQRYRSVSDYRTLLAEAGLRIDSETTIGIPDLPELSSRYREHVNHPIFSVLKVSAATT